MSGSKSAHGGDVDDRTPGASDHLAAEDLAGEQRAEQIEIEDELETFGVQIEEAGLRRSLARGLRVEVFLPAVPLG